MTGRISILLATIAVAVVLALVVPMASALPQGPTTSVQNNNVTLYTDNSTGNLSTDGARIVDPATIQNYNVGGTGYWLWANVTTAFSSGTLACNYTVTYRDATNTEQTASLNISVDASVGDKFGIVLNTSSKAIDVISVTQDAGNQTVGVFDIIVLVNKETMTVTSSGSDDAVGGYITEITVDADSQTERWQGYYGTVSGQINLTDAAGNVFHSWTWTAANGGEVLASTSTLIDWINITAAPKAEADTAYGWSSGVSDNIASTFDDVTNSTTIGGQDITNADSVALGSGANTFYAFLAKDKSAVLTSGETDHLIIGAIINNDKTAYDGSTTTDFEMLVPEKPAEGATTYYFYVELS